MSLLPGRGMPLFFLRGKCQANRAMLCPLLAWQTVVRTMTEKWQQTCLHLPVSDAHLPLFHAALDQLFELLQSEGASAHKTLGVKNPAQWLEKAQSPHHLTQRGLLDLKVIEHALQELELAELPAEIALDRFLLPHLLLAASTPQTLHEGPIWLRETLTALIAVDAESALLDVETADELLESEPGCVTLPGLAKKTLAARWISRQLPPRKLWSLLAIPHFWTQIPPELLEEAQAIHQGKSPDHQQLELREDDLFAFADAFHGLTSVRLRQRGLPTAVRVIPPGGGLLWDLTVAQIAPLGPPLSLTQTTAQGWLDPLLTALPLPRPLGQGLALAGWHKVRLHLHDPDAAAELLDATLDLAQDPLPPTLLEGPGFAIEPLEKMA